jgi:hypothetical protein
VEASTKAALRKADLNERIGRKWLFIRGMGHRDKLRAEIC